MVDISVGELTTVLENCPALEVLKVSRSGFYDEDEHALQARFAGIQSLTIECDDYDYDDCDFEIRGGDVPDYC
jgi:hypothetical protein